MKEREREGSSRMKPRGLNDRNIKMNQTLDLKEESTHASFWPSIKILTAQLFPDLPSNRP